MKEKLTLRDFRESLGMTQQELADSLCITRTYVGLVENGKKPFSDKLRRRLLKVTNPSEHGATAPPGGPRKPMGTAVSEYTAANGFRQEIDDIRERLSTIERLLVKLTSQQ